MALHITNNSGIFEIVGTLNNQNMQSLKKHFENLIEKTAMITISLDKIKEMDNAAVLCLEQLYKKAIRRNKVFYIIGQDNLLVKKRFSAKKLNYILRRDIF